MVALRYTPLLPVQVRGSGFTAVSSTLGQFEVRTMGLVYNNIISLMSFLLHASEM